MLPGGWIRDNPGILWGLPSLSLTFESDLLIGHLVVVLPVIYVPWLDVVVTFHFRPDLPVTFDKIIAHHSESIQSFSQVRLKFSYIS